MTKQLFVQAMAKFFAGVLLVALLVFLPAGTLRFSQGWLLMGVLFVPMFLAGLYLMAKDPDRLRRRLDAREVIDSCSISFNSIIVIILSTRVLNQFRSIPFIQYAIHRNILCVTFTNID